jgi:phage-related protein
MLGGAGPKLIIQVLADATNAQRGLKDAATTAGKVEQGFGRMLGPALGVVGVLGVLGATSATMASDVEQSFGALESVFKDQAGAAKDLARSASGDVGLASSEYAQLAAVLGAQLKNLTGDTDDLAGRTDLLIDLGADLSAQFGGSTADAVSALSALLRGERDPIERYGVSIKQAAVDAQAAAMGFKKNGKVYDQAAQTQATLALLTNQTADAQGAFARESDTAAHATQVATAEMKDAGAAIGTALLPLVVALAGGFAEVAKWISANVPLVQAIAVVVGVLAGAIIAVNVALAAYKAITTVVTAAQWLLNAALTANPIGIVIVAVVALVAAIVLLWQNSETFRTIVTAAFEAVSKVVGQVVGAIIRFFQTLIATIRAIFAPVANLLSGPFRELAALARSVFALVGALVRVAVSVVVQVWSALTAALSGPFNALLGVVRTVLAAIGDVIRSALAIVKAIWSTLTGVLAAPFNAVLSVVTRVFGKIKSIAQGVADFIAGIFRKIRGVVDSITGALNAIPKVGLPFSVPAPAGVAGPSTSRARAGTQSASAQGRQIVMVLDGRVFGQATLGAVRAYDRRNGAAQVIPRWS